MKTRPIPKNIHEENSDLHQKEALGHGIFMIRSRLEEGQQNFKNINVWNIFYINFYE